MYICTYVCIASKPGARPSPYSSVRNCARRQLNAFSTYACAYVRIYTVAERGNSEWRVIIVATALRHRSDVAATQRCDIAPTSLRQTRDPLAKSLRCRGGIYSAIYTTVAVVATALRHRSDVAATQRCDTALRHRSDVAATNARPISEIPETSPRRRGGAIHTDTALEKGMRTRKPRPIFLIGRRRTG